MDTKQVDSSSFNGRIQNMLIFISKFKVDFVDQIEECKRLKETNTKLELELKEARELEKSHRYHLQSSREMIGNLQDTVSQLIYLKRDVKTLKNEIISKDITIVSLEKDKENIEHRCNENITELRKSHENHIEELICINDRKLQQVRNETDTKVALLNCEVEELRNKLKENESVHKDRMNVTVLEYEEKIQRSAVEVTLLKDQLAVQTARTEANMDAYRKKLEDLEEKLKQSQFKEYLAKSDYSTQNTQSQFENRVERPYSVNRDYIESSNFNTVPVCPSPKSPKTKLPNLYTNRSLNTPALQVLYTKPEGLTNDKKGHFKITKKRKLYTDKDYLN